MKIIRFLDKHFEETASVLLLGAMTVVIALQIVLKWANAPLSFTEELARYMFIWLIYIASSYAIQKRTHIKVEILSLVVNEKGQYILDIIADVFFFIFAAVIMYFGWIATYRIGFINVQESPSLHLNMGFAYMSFALGFTLMCIRLVQDIMKRTCEYKSGKTAREDD